MSGHPGRRSRPSRFCARLRPVGALLLPSFLLAYAAGPVGMRGPSHRFGVGAHAPESGGMAVAHAAAAAPAEAGPAPVRLHVADGPNHHAGSPSHHPDGQHGPCTCVGACHAGAAAAPAFGERAVAAENAPCPVSPAPAAGIRAPCGPIPYLLPLANGPPVLG